MNRVGPGSVGGVVFALQQRFAQAPERKAEREACSSNGGWVGTVRCGNGVASACVGIAAGRKC